MRVKRTSGQRNNGFFPTFAPDMVDPQDPIVIGGQIWLSEPMTFLTDAVLAVACLWWAVAFARRHPNPAVRPWWVRFFVAMGVATFLGGIGHAISHTNHAMDVKIVGWAFSAFSIMSAEVASIRVLPQPWRKTLAPLPWVQFVVFVGAIGFYQFFGAVKINSALGLMGIVAPIHAYRHFSGQRGSGVVALGILVGISAALVSAFQLSLHKWFNYHDLGHVCMLASLWLIYRGAKATS